MKQSVIDWNSSSTQEKLEMIAVGEPCASWQQNLRLRAATANGLHSVALPTFESGCASVDRVLVLIFGSEIRRCVGVWARVRQQQGY